VFIGFNEKKSGIFSYYSSYLRKFSYPACHITYNDFFIMNISLPHWNGFGNEFEGLPGRRRTKTLCILFFSQEFLWISLRHCICEL